MPDTIAAPGGGVFGQRLARLATPPLLLLLRLLLLRAPVAVPAGLHTEAACDGDDGEDSKGGAQTEAPARWPGRSPAPAGGVAAGATVGIVLEGVEQAEEDRPDGRSGEKKPPGGAEDLHPPHGRDKRGEHGKDGAVGGAKNNADEAGVACAGGDERKAGGGEGDGGEDEAHRGAAAVEDVAEHTHAEPGGRAGDSEDSHLGGDLALVAAAAGGVLEDRAQVRDVQLERARETEEGCQHEPHRRVAQERAEAVPMRGRVHDAGVEQAGLLVGRGGAAAGGGGGGGAMGHAVGRGARARAPRPGRSPRPGRAHGPVAGGGVRLRVCLGGALRPLRPLLLKEPGKDNLLFEAHHNATHPVHRTHDGVEGREREEHPLDVQLARGLVHKDVPREQPR